MIKIRIYILLTCGDFQTAFSLFVDRAKQGDVEAQVYIGQMYGGGIGVNQDANESARWYHKAADQGSDDAQNMPQTRETTSLKWPYDVPAICSNNRTDISDNLLGYAGFGLVDKLMINKPFSEG